MKQISEFFALLFFFGEMFTIYTLVGCVSNGEPFPDWFGVVWWLYVAVFVLGVAGALMWGTVKGISAWRRWRRRRRYGGYIRYDCATERWYSEGGRR